MTLLVVTHGLGADEGFWGSTIETLETDSRMSGVEIRRWGYETGKLPDVLGLRLFNRLVRKRRKQSIDFLGKQLWSNLRVWSGSHSDIILLGHSMGGLVTAAALRHGHTMMHVGDPSLLDKVRGAVCVATPFGGARDATTLSRIYAPIGGNLHLKELRPESTVRKAIVNAFINRCLRSDDFELFLFEASRDEVVETGEVTSPFQGEPYQSDVLDGTHSGCISDLPPTNDNVEKLIAAICQLQDPVTTTSPAARRLPASDTNSSPEIPAGSALVTFQLRGGTIVQWIGPSGQDARDFSDSVLNRDAGSEATGDSIND